MKIATKTSGSGRAADSYLILIQEQPLRAIRTRKDYDAASNMIDRLAVRDDLDEGEQQYLDAIEVLIEAYENNVTPVTPDGRTPLERLKAVMRTSQTTAVKLRSILGGSQSMVSMILGGRRALAARVAVEAVELLLVDRRSNRASLARFHRTSALLARVARQATAADVSWTALPSSMAARNPSAPP